MSSSSDDSTTSCASYDDTLIARAIARMSACEHRMSLATFHLDKAEGEVSAAMGNMKEVVGRRAGKRAAKKAKKENKKKKSKKKSSSSMPKDSEYDGGNGGDKNDGGDSAADGKDAAKTTRVTEKVA